MKRVGDVLAVGLMVALGVGWFVQGHGRGLLTALGVS